MLVSINGYKFKTSPQAMSEYLSFCDDWMVSTDIIY